MLRHLAIYAVTGALTLAASRAAHADPLTLFDSVDAVEVRGGGKEITVTGILTGDTAPTSRTYFVEGNPDLMSRCERQALLAQAKPGKYRFGIGYDDNTIQVNCKLSLRTP